MKKRLQFISNYAISLRNKGMMTEIDTGKSTKRRQCPDFEEAFKSIFFPALDGVANASKNKNRKANKTNSFVFIQN